MPRSVTSNLSSPERVSGINRSDTNAQIIEKFYPSDKLDYVFVSKNGQKNPDELIDGLAVGAYAAKVSSPIVLANSKLSDKQVKALENKKISNITQVGLGPNSMAVTELLIMKAGIHTDIDTKGTNSDSSKIDSLEVNSKTVKNFELKENN